MLTKSHVFNLVCKSILIFLCAVVVALLVERLLPTPEVRSSNLVIKLPIYCQLHRKAENKEKDAVNDPLRIF